MERKIVKIYDIIPTTTEINPSKIEITTEIFEQLKSVPFSYQGETILIEATHDCLFSFVAFVVDMTKK